MNWKVRLFEYCCWALICVTMRASALPSVNKNEALLEAVDDSVDPCDDFYQFACGKWIARNPVPKSASSWSQFDERDRQLLSVLRGILESKNKADDAKPVRDARIVYRACVDKEAREKIGLQPLVDLLNTLGGWPMATSTWNESSFNWAWTSGVIRLINGDGYLISVYNDVDLMDANKHSIYIDQASLTLSRSNSLNLTDSSAISLAYKRYMLNSAKAVREWLGEAANDKQIEADVESVLAFESRLANITTTDADRRNQTLMYNPMFINELQMLTDSVNTLFGKIDWWRYLSMIYGAANVSVPEDERVIVSNKRYLTQLITLIDQTPRRVLANYMLWRFMYDWSGETTQAMRDLRFQFNQVLYGIVEPEDLDDSCVNAVNSLLGYALGAEYVKNAFKEQDNSAVKEMVGDLKASFKELVDEAAWMSPSTKKTAQDKADAMIELIGYPDWITDKAELESYYDGLWVGETCHIQNSYNISVFRTLSDLSSLRLKPDRSEWSTAPTVTNAFYSDETNSITFPAAILQSPFFVRGRLAAMNYGAIGSIIGHEITHGFDDRGRQNDKFGHLSQWWGGETLDNYERKAHCFVDQYANYSTPGGQRLDGENTLGENIADNGGLREAYRAYLRYAARNRVESGLGRFGADQVFFLSFANVYCGSQTAQSLADRVASDEHSPDRYRVIGTLSNNEDFARVFNCPVGSPMNPAKKCVLW